MASAGVGIFHLSADQGHGCVFCGSVIPSDDPTQLPLTIVTGGRTARYWSHRECFRRRMAPGIRASLDHLPPARPEDVRPPSA